MWQYNHTIDPDELCHYGVKGMKWDSSKLKKKGKKVLDEVRSAGRMAKMYGRAGVKAAKGMYYAGKVNRDVKRDVMTGRTVSNAKKGSRNLKAAATYAKAGSLETKKGRKNMAQDLVNARVKKAKKKKRY